MLLTEEEAKTKWCPFSRVIAPPREPGVSGNRFANSADDKVVVPTASVCMASACAAWRERIIGTLDVNGVEYPYYRGSKLPDGWAEIKRGYCGLAGEPDA